MAVLAEECARTGFPVDRAVDPNQTCLIGPEHSDLLTSLGQLEAKRTSTTPDVAGLIVHFLTEAGVEKGDRVAVGASGSFPALLLATLSAVGAMEAEPVTILSLGASSFGATRPGFHLEDLYRFLEDRGYVSFPAAGVSVGGEGDVGANLDPEFKAGLVRQLLSADSSGLGPSLLEATGLRANVTERMALYGIPAGPGVSGGLVREGGGGVSAFVNIGGAEANLGVSPRILDVPPGLSTELELPPEDQRGVLFEMASAGVPIIHLLHLRGLSLRYGLPWDPIPLPGPASTPFFDSHRGKGLWFWLLTVTYAISLAAVFTLGGRKEGGHTVR